MEKNVRIFLYQRKNRTLENGFFTVKPVIARGSKNSARARRRGIIDGLSGGNSGS